MRPTAVLSALNFCKDKFNLFNNDVVAWEYAKKCIQVHSEFIQVRNRSWCCRSCSEVCLLPENAMNTAQHCFWNRSKAHTGPVDPLIHYTVDFVKADGTHITTRHVHFIQSSWRYCPMLKVRFTFILTISALVSAKSPILSQLTILS